MTAQDRPFVALTGADLCQLGKKCLRKSDHDGTCWPADNERTKENA